MLRAFAITVGELGSPWNAVTVTTAVVAGLGFLLSLWNAFAAWRKDHPKVLWSGVWDDGGEHYRVTTRGVRFQLTNRGAGVARGVRMSVDGVEKWVGTVEFDQPVSFWTSLGTSIEDLFIERVRDGHEQPHTADAVVAPHAPEIIMTVSWSQLPNLHRVRTQDFEWKNPARIEGRNFGAH